MADHSIRETTLPDGRKLRGVELNFEIVKENWNEYTLADGTKLSIKDFLIQAFMLVDEDGNPIQNANGDPEIFINNGSSVVTKTSDQSNVDTYTLETDGDLIWYAIHPVSKQQVEIDPEQRWFWSSEWQAREWQAREDLRESRYEDFDNVDDFINSP
jgi:hypothetical protein